MTTYVMKHKDWIQTYTGLQFWPLEPRAADIRIVDIAHALSHKCRYSGHCRVFYSVAEHSVHVSSHVPPELALWGLLHDAAEAYLPDVPRPIKPMLTGFKEIEAKVMAAVCERYGLTVDEPPEVKRIDTAILGDEMEQIMGPPPANWYLPEEKLGIKVGVMTSREARAAFLARFCELVEGRQPLGGMNPGWNNTAFHDR
jgi:hypothetical protein